MRRRLPFIAAAAFLLPLAACGDDDTNTGATCSVPDDCYSDIAGDDRDMIAGEIECLDVEGGYCTHQCETDDDCCAVTGECDNHHEVCSPFENESAIKRCFLSCEATDVGDQDATEYCQDFAGDAFTCRSTGGGDQNRQVCLPNG